MKTIKWHKLVTLKDWGDALNDLLEAATASIQAEDNQERLAVQRALTEFIKKSPTKADSLDAIARDASREIFLETTQASIGAIATRSAQLAALRATIEGATEQAQKDAKAIQFEAVLDLAGRLTMNLETLKQLEEKLGEPDQDLLKKVKAVAEAVKKLRETVKET